MNRIKIGLILGSSFLFLFILWIINSGEYLNIKNIIYTLNPIWLFAGLICISIYWMIEALIIYLFANQNHTFQFSKALKVALIGQFFSGVTPFSTGGQPAQLLEMHKNKVPIGESSSYLMSKFIIYQTTLVVFTGSLLILKASFFMRSIDNLFVLVVIGFSVNLFVIMVLIFFSNAKHTNLKIIKKLIMMMSRIKIIKKPEKKIEDLSKHILVFHNQIKVMMNEKVLMLKIIGITFIQLSLYFSVPYFIYKSFGLSGVPILNIISATAFVMMITAFIPMPGASGGAEGGFYMIFSLFFIAKLIVPALLIWRILTYYLWMLVGGSILIFNNKKLRSII